MSKSTWVILIILFLLQVVPNKIQNEKYNFDRPRNEGYIAFIVNEKDDKKEETIEKCSCDGSKVMVHGDGHKTPCKCINNGKECKCAKTSQEASVLPVPQIVAPVVVAPVQNNNSDSNNERRFRFRRR